MLIYLLQSLYIDFSAEKASEKLYNCLHKFVSFKSWCLQQEEAIEVSVLVPIMVVMLVEIMLMLIRDNRRTAAKLTMT